MDSSLLTKDYTFLHSASCRAAEQDCFDPPRLAALMQMILKDLVPPPLGKPYSLGNCFREIPMVKGFGEKASDS